MSCEKSLIFLHYNFHFSSWIFDILIIWSTLKRKWKENSATLHCTAVLYILLISTLSGLQAGPRSRKRCSVFGCSNQLVITSNALILSSHLVNEVNVMLSLMFNRANPAKKLSLHAFPQLHLLRKKWIVAPECRRYLQILMLVALISLKKIIYHLVSD